MRYFQLVILVVVDVHARQTIHCCSLHIVRICHGFFFLIRQQKLFTALLPPKAMGHPVEVDHGEGRNSLTCG